VLGLGGAALPRPFKPENPMKKLFAAALLALAVPAFAHAADEAKPADKSAKKPAPKKEEKKDEKKTDAPPAKQ
jgi:hypothetical protein